MNSFFVPRLGSQIYTMAGMATQLNLEADQPGHFDGFSAQFSGDGFSDMKFGVDADTPEQFSHWIAEAKAGADGLDQAGYAKLQKTSSHVAPLLYHSVDQGLFERIVAMSSAPAPGSTSSSTGVGASASPQVSSNASPRAGVQ